MKVKPSSSWEEDTAEMIEWRSMSQKEMDQCWKELAGKMEEEVLNKYKVEDSKRGAYRGRGCSLCGKAGSTGYESGEDCRARIFALFREYNLQRRQSMHEDSTDQEEMRRQQRMKVMKDMTKKLRSKRRMDAGKRWWVAERKRGSIQKKKKKRSKNCILGWRR